MRGYEPRLFLSVPIELFAPNFAKLSRLVVRSELRSLSIYKCSASTRNGPKALGGRSLTISLFSFENSTLRDGYNILIRVWEPEPPKGVEPLEWILVTSVA